MFTRSLFLLVAVGVASLASFPIRADILPAEVIGLTGQALPGVPAGAYPTSFGFYTSLPSGDFLLEVDLVGTLNDTQLLWVDENLDFTALGPPFGGNAEFNEFGRIASYTGNSAQAAISLQDGAGAATIQAQKNVQAPGMPLGALYSAFGNSANFELGSDGSLLYTARVAGGGVSTNDDQGLWLIPDGGSPALVLREGDPAPTPVPGDVFSNSFSFGVGIRAVDDLGGAVLSTTIGSGQSTLWRLEPGGSLSFRSRGGLGAPGFGAGVGYVPSGFAALDPMGSGEIVGTGELDGPNSPSFSKTAMYRYDPGGTPNLLLSCGDPLVGVGETDACIIVVDRLFWRPNREIVFRGSLNDPAATIGATNDQALWRIESDDSLSLIAREPFATTPDRGNLLFDFGFDNVATNAQGLIRLHDVLYEADLTTSIGTGIVIIDPAGSAHVLVRRFDKIEIAPGFFCTLDAPTQSILTDDDDVIFIAPCIGGGSGIFRMSATMTGTPVPSIGPFGQIALVLCVALASVLALGYWRAPH